METPPGVAPAPAPRPPPSPCHTAPSWWNGWRWVHPIVLGTALDVEPPKRVDVEPPKRVEHRLARAKCSKCRRSFTCYPDELYPRRQFQLDVVARAVAQVSLGAASAPAAARSAGASATSVRRWTAWVAGIAEPHVLLGVAARLDPDAPVGAGLSAATWGSGVRARAGRVLTALEHLGMALVRRGVALAARTGLGRVLGWQRLAHGDVPEPETRSPGMALGGAPVSR
jgi:Domain of unknown function (DUF6431)